MGGLRLVLNVLLLVTVVTKGSPVCHKDADCGWNALCLSGSCECKQGFVLSQNNKDCVDTYCEDPQCIECLAKQVCHRCVNFVEENTGKCVDNCDGYYKLRVEGNQVGRVCQEVTVLWTPMFVAILVGVIAVVLVVCLMGLACYWKLKSDKERKLRFEVLNKELNKGEKIHTQKQVSQYLSFENPAYDSPDSTNNRRSHLTALKNMSILRRHTDTLIHMYNEAKMGVRRLPVDNRMCRKYRSIAHHLGRVLSLVGDPDPTLNSDTYDLLEWALKLLKDYMLYKQEKSHNMTSSSGHHNYSLDTGTLGNAVTPGSSLTRLTSAFQPPDYLTQHGDYTLSNGHIPGDVSPSTTTMSFTYERMPGYSTFQRDREVSFIELRDQFTEPVCV